MSRFGFARSRRRTTALATPVAAAILFLAGAAADGAAQLSDLESRCISAGGSTESCAAAVEIADIAGSRAILLAAGASPVPGSASTLGQRSPGLPRWSLAVRGTSGRIELPDPQTAGDTRSGLAMAWSADLAVGIIDGIPALATVGGVGSVDVLASFGIVNLPKGAGFGTRSPVSFGAGARLGILRESFTVPGISVSAMYRRLGSFSAGDAPTALTGARVRSESTTAWTVRAAIGKRIALFGVTGGFAWDRLSSDLSLEAAGSTGVVQLGDDSYVSSRTSLFGGVVWTRLVYSLSAELGWQRSVDLSNGREPFSGAGGGGLFLSLAGRLTI